MPADLPKFDALRTYLDQTLVAKLSPLAYGHLSLKELMTPVGTWIDKLEGWSKERLAELEKAEAGLEKTRQELESYERMLSESQDLTDAYNDLVEVLRDVDRGIRDWPEVQDLLPDLETKGEIHGKEKGDGH